jgi:hypothetical protein
VLFDLEPRVIGAVTLSLGELFSPDDLVNHTHG